MPYPAIARRLIAPAAALAALLLTVVTAGAASASAQNSSAQNPSAQNPSAQTSLPVNYDFAAGAAATFSSPATPPPGRQQFLLPAQRRPSVSGGPGARDPGQHE